MAKTSFKGIATFLTLLPCATAVHAAAEDAPDPRIAYADDLLDDTFTEESAGRPVVTPPISEPERKYARNYFNIGVGVITTPSYNGSDKNNIVPGGLLRGRIKGYSFSTRGTNLSVDILREKRRARTDFKLGPVISMRSERAGKLRDPQVAALGKLDRALEIGGTIGVQRSGIITSKYDQLGAKVTILTDISGQHKGTIIAPGLDYGTPLSKTTYLGFNVSTSWVTKSVGRYYSDVDAAGSAASGLPVYQRAGAKAGFNKYAVGMAMVQSLSGDLRKGASVVGGIQYNELLGRYASTPIVSLAGKSGTWSAGMGLAYSF